MLLGGAVLLVVRDLQLGGGLLLLVGGLLLLVAELLLLLVGVVLRLVGDLLLGRGSGLHFHDVDQVRPI